MKLLEYLGTRKDKNSHIDSRGLFLCPKCKKIVERILNIGKRDKTCGCGKKGITNPNYKHGESKTIIFKKWQRILNRCLNPNKDNYNYYGGRGITICPEWTDKLNGYINFRNWALNNGYREGLEIDRIDNNGNYEPSNCRWVTHKENMQNTRRNKMSFIKANEIRNLYATKNFSQRELAKNYGISQQLIFFIIKNQKWINND